MIPHTAIVTRFWFWKRSQDSQRKERKGFSTNGGQKTEYPHAKNEVGHLPHTIYKNLFKMDQRSKFKKTKTTGAPV